MNTFEGEKMTSYERLVVKVINQKKLIEDQDRRIIGQGDLINLQRERIAEAAKALDEMAADHERKVKKWVKSAYKLTNSEKKEFHESEALRDRAHLQTVLREKNKEIENLQKDRDKLIYNSIHGKRNLLIDFFRFFRDNGEQNIEMSIEEFVDKYISDYH